MGFYLAFVAVTVPLLVAAVRSYRRRGDKSRSFDGRAIEHHGDLYGGKNYPY